ncbi:alpha/beta hydrolase [Staphylococcus succinus]|uniref:alpha/beta hydrolase n=1 Tax=Staphylococcus succinus TaxID=61015 RepID=UPI001C710E8D|nr:alpha/beta hydrolase [Staphylococcus succinus]
MNKEIIERNTTELVAGYDGLKLYLNKDYPHNLPKAVLVISHGLAVHSHQFVDFSKTMNNNDVAVYRFDARGHGKSDGRDKIHLNSYFEMVEDLRLVVEKAKIENPNIPIYVMGHSMGGHITALYTTKYPQAVDGVILAGAVLRYSQLNLDDLPRPEPADSFVNGIEIMHKIFDLPMEEKDSDWDDPLILETFSVSFMNGFKEGIQYLKANAEKFNAPVLLVSGSDDLNVVPKDAIDFYQETTSKDKSLRLYSGLGHYLMFEPNGDLVVTDIVGWINQRVHK